MWNKMMEQKVNTPFIIFFDCSEDTMIKRCLKRGELAHRTDDNLEVLKKRFKTFHDETMFVINHFDKLNKVVKIQSEKGVDDIYKELS